MHISLATAFLPISCTSVLYLLAPLVSVTRDMTPLTTMPFCDVIGRGPH